MSIDDLECPFCWGLGWITVMEIGREGEGLPVKRRCPEECPPLDVDAVHDPAAVIPRRVRRVPP